MEAVLSQVRRLKLLLEDGSIWRARELRDQGITAAAIRRAVEAGEARVLSRGVYQKPDGGDLPNQDIAQVCSRTPGAVIALYSAAYFHGLVPDRPEAVWIGIANSRKPPLAMPVAIRTVQWRQSAALTIGVTATRIAGVTVHVTDPARTIIDMLRLPQTVELATAFRCLKTYLSTGRSETELLAYAVAFRCDKTLAPLIKLAAQMEAGQTETGHAEHRSGDLRKAES